MERPLGEWTGGGSEERDEGLLHHSRMGMGLGGASRMNDD